MNEPLPQIEPLAENLKLLDVGEYLKSREFKRYCLQAGIAEYWREKYVHVKKTRRFFSMGMDHEKYDAVDTLNILLNDLYQNYDNQQLFTFLQDFLNNFYIWSKGEINLELIIEDLELLQFPQETLEFLTALNLPDSVGVPNVEFNDLIDNPEKLNLIIKKMDLSIQKTEYNLTLTYAYSALEGIFKAYIIAKNLDEHKLENELAKVAKIVRDNIKKQFETTESTYPEQIINLISVITNAVSNARNSFSDSHFDKDSEKWLAEFVRDSVNSVGRLILNLLK